MLFFNHVSDKVMILNFVSLTMNWKSSNTYVIGGVLSWHIFIWASSSWSFIISQRQPPLVFCKKSSVNSQENTCARDSFLIKVSGTGFSCEICEISKNTFFTEYLQMTASDKRVDVFVNNIFDQCSIQFLQLNIEKS